MSIAFEAYNGSESVGSMVAEFPGASNIMKKYGIDFCCGGNLPLEQVCRKQGLDLAEVLARLNDARRARASLDNEKDWRKASAKELIDEIVDRHHAFLKNEMPLLSEFTTKILRVHGAHHPESLQPLHQYFHEFKRELEEHMVKEEQDLFPLMLAYEQNPTPELFHQAASKLEELEREHEHAGNLLKQMREVTNDYTLPEDACRTYTVTFNKLEELESDMFQHIHLENNILFLRYVEDCGCGH